MRVSVSEKTCICFEGTRFEPCCTSACYFFVLGGGYFSLIFLFLFVFLLVLEILVKWKRLWLLDYYLKFSLILSHFLTPAHDVRTVVAAGIKLVDVLSLDPCKDFHQIFRVYYPQEDLELIRFSGYLVTTITMATLNIFGS